MTEDEGCLGCLGSIFAAVGAWIIYWNVGYGFLALGSLLVLLALVSALLSAVRRRKDDV